MSEIWWTDERLDELRLRWIAGQTASEICRAMHATSRNAVLGKAFRLKLPARISKFSQQARQSNKARKRRIRHRKAIERRGEHITMVEEKPPPPDFANAKSFAELREGDCRWPGPGPVEQLQFCAAPVLNGYSYCAGHCRIAYTPHSRMRVWHR
jgi:GcrA cell cycle regulator